MWNYLAPILIIGGLVLFILYEKKLLFFKRLLPVTKETRMQKIIDTLVVQTNAISGVFPRVLSQAPLSEQMTAGIKEGFRERIARARDVYGWTAGLDPAGYTILVFPSVRDHDSNGNYAPSFQVFFDKGDPYDGSIYDQEPNSPAGWTFAAEQVLQNNVNGRLEPVDVFVIAMNDREDYSARVTSYGLDHLFAWKNDRGIYESTKDHSQGGGHPLW